MIDNTLVSYILLFYNIYKYNPINALDTIQFYFKRIIYF